MTRRSGFTLLELMISVTLTLVIMGTAVQFLRRQSNAVAADSQRMDALQNAQFASAQIERDLREAGAGVADEQPMMVQLDSFAVTFNANLVSRDPKDLAAVYRVPDADPNGVRLMLPSEALPLPTSKPAHSYPDSTYYAAKGVQSSAETISYYFTKDTTVRTSDTYVLWRRVNALPATVIARNIVRSLDDTIPFLTYYRQDTLSRLIPIPRTRYPLYHVPLHGSIADTAASALTDSVRVVRLHFVALTYDPRAGRDSLRYRTVETRVRLLNAGLLQLSACGATPNPVGSPTVVQIAPTPTTRAAVITWSRAPDDAAGEKDIVRYAIYRAPAGSTTRGDPIASVPASAVATYKYTDTSVLPGASYVYGIAAQDCTPTSSDVALAPAITINP